MNLERIREKLRNGFRPFSIHLSSGRSFAVPHSEFIMTGKNVVVILGKDDSVTTIDPLHIAAIEDLPAKRGQQK